MAKALLNGIQVHYQTKGTGPQVVLIHGITSCLAQWFTTIMPDLARDHCVTAYDLRGHGLTDLTPNGYESGKMAEDLKALLDHLGIQKCFLVGHSYGGAIALHFALLHPERVQGIVVLDTGLACLRHLRTIRDWPGWKRWGSQLARFGITLDEFLEVDKNQDVTEWIRRSLSVPLTTGFRKGKYALTPRLKRLLDETRMGYEFREIGELTEEALGRIENPVLAVYGALSPYEKMAQRLSQLLPLCRYEVLSEAGHFYASEEPDLVIRRVRDFVRDPAGYVRVTAAPDGDHRYRVGLQG